MRDVALILDRRNLRHTVFLSLYPLFHQRFFRVRQYIADDIAHFKRLFAEVPEQVVAIVPHFSQDPNELRAALETCQKSLVLMDTFDQSSSPLLPLIDAVDVYAKNAVLKSRQDYCKIFRGNFIFTDWLTSH